MLTTALVPANPPSIIRFRDLRVLHPHGGGSGVGDRELGTGLKVAGARVEVASGSGEMTIVGGLATWLASSVLVIVFSVVVCGLLHEVPW